MTTGQSLCDFVTPVSERSMVINKQAFSDFSEVFFEGRDVTTSFWAILFQNNCIIYRIPQNITLNMILSLDIWGWQNFNLLTMWLSSHYIYVVFWSYYRMRREWTFVLLTSAQVLFIWGVFQSQRRAIPSGTTPIELYKVPNWNRQFSVEQCSPTTSKDHLGPVAISSNWLRQHCHTWDLYLTMNCAVNGRKISHSILVIQGLNWQRKLFSAVQVFKQDSLQ